MGSHVTYVGRPDEMVEYKNFVEWKKSVVRGTLPFLARHAKVHPSVLYRLAQGGVAKIEDAEKIWSCLRQLFGADVPLRSLCIRDAERLAMHAERMEKKKAKRRGGQP